MSQDQEETENDDATPLIPNGWRAASKELPPENEDVLIATTYRYAPHSERRELLRAEYVGDGWFHSEETEWPIITDPGEENIYHRVTHWAPMPTLPERVEEMPERGEVKTDNDKRIRRMNPNT